MSNNWATSPLLGWESHCLACLWEQTAVLNLSSGPNYYGTLPLLQLVPPAGDPDGTYQPQVSLLARAGDVAVYEVDQILLLETDATVVTIPPSGYTNIAVGAGGAQYNSYIPTTGYWWPSNLGLATWIGPAHLLLVALSRIGDFPSSPHYDYVVAHAFVAIPSPDYTPGELVQQALCQLDPEPGSYWPGLLGTNDAEVGNWVFHEPRSRNG